MFIANKENSILNHFLAELREVDIQKDRQRFRRNLERVAEILAYEISKTLYFQGKEIQTPLQKTAIQLLYDFPVIISVMRAGLPFHQGFLNIFDHSDSGFLGAYRKHNQSDEDFSIFLGYKALPSIQGRTVILVDPMLATGKSMVRAIETILEAGRPDHVILASAIATPEAIKYLNENLKINYSVFIGAMDDKLNDKAYILPGLGDAGDLSFGNKSEH